MSKQMTFKLPKIDPKGTKDVVEEAMEKYHIYLLQESLDRLPKITASYSIQPPSFGNEFHSSTEDAAVSNVDYVKERTDYMQRIIRAVNRLSYQERSIIIKRYMADDQVFDYEVYNEVGMSERSYYRVKSRAFYKLAFLLKIEVLEERSDNELCTADS